MLHIFDFDIDIQGQGRRLSFKGVPFTQSVLVHTWLAEHVIEIDDAAFLDVTLLVTFHLPL